MAEFKPNRRVRCADCVSHAAGRCVVKEEMTASRKRRICASYVFSGNLQNRTPLPAEPRPFWWFYSKKEKKLLAHLMSLGVKPVDNDTVMVPQSTALLPMSGDPESFNLAVGDVPVPSDPDTEI